MLTCILYCFGWLGCGVSHTRVQIDSSLFTSQHRSSSRIVCHVPSVLATCTRRCLRWRSTRHCLPLVTYCGIYNKQNRQVIGPILTKWRTVKPICIQCLDIYFTYYYFIKFYIMIEDIITITKNKFISCFCCSLFYFVHSFLKL